MRFIGYIIALSLIAEMLVGCKATNNVANLQSSQTVGNVKLVDKEIKTANFSSISVEFSLNGNTIASRAAMKIQTDSIIQLSIIPALGIEVARINFMPDSILVVDKINQKYLCTTYDSLLLRINLPLGYTDLQSFFLNKLFIAAEKPMPFAETLTKFSNNPFPDGIMLKSKPSPKGINSDFVVNKNSDISMATIMFPSSVVRCNYTAFEETNDIRFPRNLKIVFMQGPKINQAEISINNVEFNKPVRINKIDLSNYLRVSSIDQIIPN